MQNIISFLLFEYCACTWE